jgi:hypothetical protein
MGVIMQKSGMQEALAMLIEELGECVQDAGKYLRHGPIATDDQPGGDGRTYDNVAALDKELLDVNVVALLCAHVGVLGRPQNLPIWIGRSFLSDCRVRDILLKRFQRIHDPELKEYCAELIHVAEESISNWAARNIPASTGKEQA